MKILILITGLGMGGAEHVVVNLADGLAKRKYEVKIVHLTGEAIVLPKSPCVNIESLGMKSKLDFIKAYKRLVEIIENYSPDVVHAHMFHANLLSRLVRLSVKIPRLICSAHSTNEGGLPTMLAYRVTDRLADLSTNVSQEAVDIFLRKGASKQSRMIPVLNGIDTDHFCFSEKDRNKIRADLGLHDSKFILAVGRLDEAKDYPNLLKAFNLLRKKYNADVKLAIVGDGVLRSVLENLVNELDLIDKVQFLGIRHDVPQLMSAADIFALSSRFEGFGLVVAEAMACERVVVATDCGGVKEVVGDAGYLVQPQSYTALANKMLEVLDKPTKELSDIGRKARLRVQKLYSLESNINNYVRIYKSSFQDMVK